VIYPVLLYYIYAPRPTRLYRLRLLRTVYFSWLALLPKFLTNVPQLPIHPHYLHSQLPFTATHLWRWQGIYLLLQSCVQVSPGNLPPAITIVQWNLAFDPAQPLDIHSSTPCLNSYISPMTNMAIIGGGFACECEQPFAHLFSFAT